MLGLPFRDAVSFRDLDTDVTVFSMTILDTRGHLEPFRLPDPKTDGRGVRKYELRQLLLVRLTAQAGEPVTRSA